MKRTTTLIALFLVSQVALSVWYGTATTFYTGTQNNPNWGAAITIAANNNVVFNNAQFSGGSLTIKAGATLTINQSSFQGNGPIWLEAGATLVINGNFDINSSTVIQNNGGTIHVTGNVNHSQSLLTVNQGGSMIVDGTFSVSSGNLNIEANGSLQAANLILNGNNSFGGTVTVTNTVTINGGTNTFKDCSQLTTAVLKTGNANTITGKGFIRILNTYNNGSNSGWSGQALTNSSNILVNYTGPSTAASFGSATLTSSTVGPCYTVLSESFRSFYVSETITGLIDLNWTAFESQETTYYEIEVSTDGQNFAPVKRVNAYETGAERNYQIKLNY